MDWYNNSSRRSSITTGQPTYPSPAFHGTIMSSSSSSSGNNNNNNNNHQHTTASASLSHNPNMNTNFRTHIRSNSYGSGFGGGGSSYMSSNIFPGSQQRLNIHQQTSYPLHTQQSSPSQSSYQPPGSSSSGTGGAGGGAGAGGMGINLSGQSTSLSPISHSSNSPNVGIPPSTPLERNSYFFSQFPLYASDWIYLNHNQLDCIALGSYKEGFTNKLEIIHGNKYERNQYSMHNTGTNNNYNIDNLVSPGGGNTNLMYNNTSRSSGGYYEEQDNNKNDNVDNEYDEYDDVNDNDDEEDGSIEGYNFQKVCDVNLDYPITHLQWDPLMLLYGANCERLAASSEVLRLYKVVDNGDDSYSLQQTHTLANNTAAAAAAAAAAATTTRTSSNSSHSSSSGNNNNNNKSTNTTEDITTYPPVTSFDWNKTDPNILITSSVDTTCTVWDLHRSHPRSSPGHHHHHNNNNNNNNNTDNMTDTATVKTQLIAHDSEVFDVKFMHKSTNVFASVGNDGSMRVFDLRSLEHSTIIYEPPPPTSTSSSSSSGLGFGNPNSSTFNSKALLTLTTSNIDQHHLATVGINSNQVIIIDMRMPGLPVVTIDGSLGGISHSLINLIKWHPTSNYLLTGGDDCQALVWDINNLPSSSSGMGSGNVQQQHNNNNNTFSTNSNPNTTANGGSNNTNTNNTNNNGSGSGSSQTGLIIDTPVLAYTEDLEINNVCWRQNQGDWMGVVSGKGFQAVLI